MHKEYIWMENIYYMCILCIWCYKLWNLIIWVVIILTLKIRQLLTEALLLHSTVYYIVYDMSLVVLICTFLFVLYLIYNSLLCFTGRSSSSVPLTWPEPVPYQRESRWWVHIYYSLFLCKWIVMLFICILLHSVVATRANGYHTYTPIISS